jgi:hypothetical protein
MKGHAMTISRRRSADLDGRALLRAQRHGDRQHSMFFVLLGLMAANRKLVHKSARLGETAPTDHTPSSDS